MVSNLLQLPILSTKTTHNTCFRSDAEKLLPHTQGSTLGRHSVAHYVIRNELDKIESKQTVSIGLTSKPFK